MATPKRLIILDAHAIIHRAYHALPDFTSDKGEPTGALYGLFTMLLKIVADLKPDYIVAAYDLPKPTHRHHAFEDYKATRVETDTELAHQIDRSRDVFAAFGIPIYESEGFEADDIIGTIVSNLKQKKSVEIIIASGDMDTLQLVEEDRVRVYTLKRGLSDTIMYDEAAVQERFGFHSDLIPDYKGLRGDPSDNIPGVRGIGDKGATTLIQAFGTLEDIYEALEKDREAFISHEGITERIATLLADGKEDAIFSKMLAVIRDDAPIAFAIPKQEWELQAHSLEMLELCDELGFRTIRDRVQKLTGIEPKESDEPETSEDEYDPKDIEEVGVMLWLLRSEITNPTLEDIYAHTKKRNLSEARTVLKTELAQEGKLLEVFETIEKPLLPVVHRMEERGVTIDTKYLETLAKKYRKELEAIEESIFEHAGKTFNVNSPKQLGEVLYGDLELSVKNQKRTSTGQRSTRESELEKIKDQHPIIEEILEYRELQKLLSTYIDNIPPLLDADNRLHADFIQSGTTTGRMASQQPNLQNIPIRSDRGRAIRNAFIPGKGYKIAALDYSQIELRIAALLSGDEKLIAIFAENKDVHQAVAEEVFDVPADEVTPDMRARAKAINFGILYGMGAQSLRKATNSTLAEAQEYLREYFTTYKKLAEFLEEQKGSARTKGYTETLFGRRRYFEGIQSSLPYVRAQAERMALNAPIQGTQADIIKLAMVEADTYIQKNNIDAHLLMQVHDELVYEVKREEDVLKIKEIMEGVLGEEGAVPIIADAKIGVSWGELETIS